MFRKVYTDVRMSLSPVSSRQRYQRPAESLLRLVLRRTNLDEVVGKRLMVEAIDRTPILESLKDEGGPILHQPLDVLVRIGTGCSRHRRGNRCPKVAPGQTCSLGKGERIQQIEDTLA